MAQQSVHVLGVREVAIHCLEFLALHEVVCQQSLPLKDFLRSCSRNKTHIGGNLYILGQAVKAETVKAERIKAFELKLRRAKERTRYLNAITVRRRRVGIQVKHVGTTIQHAQP